MNDACETWRDVPGFKLEISSQGRVRSSASGRLKVARFRRGVWEVSAQDDNRRPVVLSVRRILRLATDGPVSNGGSAHWSNQDIAKLQAAPTPEAAAVVTGRTVKAVRMKAYKLGLRLTLGGPVAKRANRRWCSEDLKALQSATTVEAAATAVGRTIRAVEHQLVRMGLKKERAQTVRKARPVKSRIIEAGPVRGSVPYLDTIWAAAHEIVPRSMAPHIRDDLISEMVLLTLEGVVPTMAQAFKVARRNYHRLMGTYTERSLDAPVPGTDNRMIDLIASDREHF